MERCYYRQGGGQGPGAPSLAPALVSSDLDDDTSLCYTAC